MLYYINQHLIAEDLARTETWTTRDGVQETYDQYVVKTAGGATRVINDGEVVPSSIIICRHNVSHEPSAKTRVRNVESQDGKIRTRVQTSVVNKYNDDVFVVALPYDGLIVPMDVEGDQLAVWRYLILKSSSMNIEHNDRKYRRVLYMVVSPRGPVEADGWYSNEHNLVLRTIKSNVGKGKKPDANSKWTVTINTVRFGEDGTYEITTDTETVPYDVYAHVAEDMKAPVVECVPPVGSNRGESDHPRNREDRGIVRPKVVQGKPKAAPAPVYDKDADYNDAPAGGKKKNRRKKRKH